jgi:hypothetical protein
MNSFQLVGLPFGPFSSLFDLSDAELLERKTGSLAPSAFVPADRSLGCLPAKSAALAIVRPRPKPPNRCRRW